MALTIRLRKQGRKNQPHYRVVVTDSRNKRDGKYVEAIGWYDPIKEGEENVMFKPDRLKYWIDNGATISENVEALIARGAPEIARMKKEKEMARRAKMQAKRKARKQKSEG